MNRERIEELTLNTNLFNERLKEAYAKYENKNNEIQLNRRCITESNKSKNNIKKEKKISNQVFKELEPWRPTHTHGNYFENFNKLEPKYEMNNWEVNRIPNLIPRSYEKFGLAPKFKCRKDIVPPFVYGKSFDELKKTNSNSKLGEYGASLINKFIEQNTREEQMLKEKEEEIWRYKHSKPPVIINKWYPVKSHGKEFSKIPVDAKHEFVEIKQKFKYVNDEAFRIPKKDGDYFYDREKEKENQLHY